MTLSDPISKSAATPGRKCDTRSILLPQWVAKAPSKRHHTPQHPHQIFRFGKLLGTQARVLLSRPCGSDSALIAGMRTNGQPAESHAVPAAPFRPAAANATSTAMRSRCGTQQHGRMVTRYDSHTGWMPPSLPQNDTCTHSPFDAPTPHPFQNAGGCTFPLSPGILIPFTTTTSQNNPEPPTSKWLVSGQEHTPKMCCSDSPLTPWKTGLPHRRLSRIGKTGSSSPEVAQK